ncbi:SusD/RagB family nutrient-binding outer membrane lipoprotein [Sungkyunkwania multivorans]|uniref:SusD/RagB family nutrient-binding outer membrane lipoprotein n=1 Tax=Sungkyunkwania multivorans TaxID=1173618 RepID=A0ABW3CVS7_9FLAO
MKKHIVFSLLAGFVGFTACESLELDLTENPNALVDSQADVDFFLNSIQEDFVRHLDGDANFDPNDNFVSGGNTNGDGLSNIGLELTRVDNLNGRQYLSAYQGSDFNDEWTNAYTGILKDIRTMTPLAEAADQVHHIGIAQFIEAYVISSLVDFFGDIPYDEALQGTANLNPNVDGGASVYDAALTLLDAAIANFEASASSDPAYDLFYDNDYDAWVTAANTLKMKLYLQRRLVDGSALSSFQTIVDAGDYITTTGEDFEYKWGATSVTNPDTRHPRYGLNYQAAGAGDYMSNWLMNFMDTTDDPRIRYYYYRQTDAVPGADIAPNEEVLNCSLEAPPQHYIDGGFTFCYLRNGYWGRDHGDTDGVPPDGFLRTTYGVYPYGGRFDDDSFQGIGPGQGGAGAGITPIVTATLVDFMVAEKEMVENDPAGAAIALEAGMRKSIAKAMSFGSLDSGADFSFAPSMTDVDTYVQSIIDAFNDATAMEDKWDILGEQYLIAQFGMGVDCYNFYRRTGYPRTLQPNLEPDPGTFIRSMFYPSNVVNTNSSISQKGDQTQTVFWDNNPTAPEAN